jgi:hypothetical protein
VLDVNATEANARSGRASFTDFAVWPALCAVAEKITNDVLPAYAAMEPGGGSPLVGMFEDVRGSEREVRTKERRMELDERQMKLDEQREYARVHTVDEVRERFYGSSPLATGAGGAIGGVEHST